MASTLTGTAGRALVRDELYAGCRRSCDTAGRPVRHRRLSWFRPGRAPIHSRLLRRRVWLLLPLPRRPRRCDGSPRPTTGVSAATTCTATAAFLGENDRSERLPGRWPDVRDVVHVLRQRPATRLATSQLLERPSASRPPRALRPHPVRSWLWAPPTLSSPITINVSNQNSLHLFRRRFGVPVKMPSSPLTVSGGLSLIGSRNVVIVGGEIFRDTPVLLVRWSGCGVRDRALSANRHRPHRGRVGTRGPGIGQAILLAHTDSSSYRLGCPGSRTAGSRASIRSTGMSTQTRFSPMVGLECCGSIGTR